MSFRTPPATPSPAGPGPKDRAGEEAGELGVNPQCPLKARGPPGRPPGLKAEKILGERKTPRVFPKRRLQKEGPGLFLRKIAVPHLPRPSGPILAAPGSGRAFGPTSRGPRESGGGTSRPPGRLRGANRRLPPKTPALLISFSPGPKPFFKPWPPKTHRGVGWVPQVGALACGAAGSSRSC